MEQTKYLSGELNLDVSPELLADGDYCDARNIIIGNASGDQVGPVEKMKGSLSRLDVLENYMGSCSDQTNEILYVINRSSGSLRIRGLKNNAVILDITKGTAYDGLGSGLIENIVYLDDYIFMSNGGEVLQVYVGAGAVSSTEDREVDVTLIKQTPSAPLETTSFSNSSDTPFSDDWQFSYFYRFVDEQESQLAPYSDLVRRLNVGIISSRKDNPVTSVKLRIPHSPQQFTNYEQSTCRQYDEMPLGVKEIVICGRKGNIGVWQELHTMKRNAADFDTNSFTFKGNASAAIDESKQQIASTLPRNPKSLTTASNRLFMANFDEGYDIPDNLNVQLTIDASITSTYNADPNDYDAADLRSGRIDWAPQSRYQFGVVLFDKHGRSSGVHTKEDWIAELKHDNWVTKSSISVTTNNLGSANLPDWCHKVAIVSTKDLNNSYFIEGVGSKVYYVHEVDGETFYSITPDKDGNNASHIALNIRGFLEDGGGYDREDGDIIRVHCIKTGASTYGSHETKVLRVEGEWIYMPFEDLGTFFSSQVIFQILRSRDSEEVKPFYETRYTLNRRELSDGGGWDSLYRYGGVLAGDAVTKMASNIYVTPIEGSGETTYSKFPIPVKQASLRNNEEGTSVWESSIGRPFMAISAGKSNRPNCIRWGGTKVKDTKLNSLGSFLALDETETPLSDGSINKLHLTTDSHEQGTNLLAICANNTSSMYLEQRSMSTASGDSFMLYSSDMVGNVRPHASRFGTKFPLSVQSFKGKSWWFDSNTSDFVEHTSNGVRSISDSRVRSFFTDVKDVIVGYDVQYKLVMITVTRSNDEKETIAYEPFKGKWRTTVSLSPADYARVGKKSFYVLNNEVFELGVNNNRCEFSGVTQDSWVEMSFNDDPMSDKLYTAFAMQCAPSMSTWQDAERKFIDTGIRVDFSNDEQTTDLVHGDFDIDESQAYGAVMRDTNTGTALTGEEMRSVYLKVKLTMKDSLPASILFFRLGHIQSSGHRF